MAHVKYFHALPDLDDPIDDPVYVRLVSIQQVTQILIFRR